MTDDISDFIPTKEVPMLPWTEQEGGWILGRLEKAGLGIYVVKDIEKIPQKFYDQIIETNIVIDKKEAKKYVYYDPEEHILLNRKEYEDYVADVKKLVDGYDNYIKIVQQHNKIMAGIFRGDYDNAPPQEKPTADRTEENRIEEAKDGSETKKPKEQLGFFKRLFR